jgi:hypothetical protein
VGVLGQLAGAAHPDRLFATARTRVGERWQPIASPGWDFEFAVAVYPVGGTSRHCLPPPGGRQCLAPIGMIERLGWSAGVDRIDRYPIPALSGSQPN